MDDADVELFWFFLWLAEGRPVPWRGPGMDNPSLDPI